MNLNLIYFKYLIFIVICGATSCSPQQDNDSAAGSEDYQINSQQDIVEPNLEELTGVQAPVASKHTTVPRFNYESVPDGFSRLPVTSLYRYVPSAHAKTWNACGMSDSFSDELRIVVAEIGKLSFDSDYTNVARQLSTGDLKNDPDAMAILGMLYEQHLVPDVAFLSQSDDLAFTLYERSALAGSDRGRYYLALSHYYGYPTSRKYNPARLSELLADVDLESRDSQLLQLKANLLIQGRIADPKDESRTAPELGEALFRRALEVCPEDGYASANLASFLINYYGAQSAQGTEALSLLNPSEFPNQAELVGIFYEYGNLNGSFGYFLNAFVDLPKAIENYKIAALNGDPDAALRLFELYLYDEEVDDDLIDQGTARELLELAAGLGNWRSMSYLSHYYAEGSELYEKNIPLALHYSRSFLRMLDTDETISRDDAIEEAFTIIGGVLSDENLQPQTLLSGIELANQLIDILESDEVYGDSQQLGLATASLVSLGAALTDKQDADVQVAQSALAAALEDLNFGEYYALVIGNDKYDYLSDLESAVADANAVSELLKRDYGFKVTQLNNASRAQIVTILNEFRNTLGVADNFLLYYAGHGQIDPITEEGFWQPVDAEEFDDTNWIGNDRITRTIRGFRSQNILVVADSCYSGVVLRGGNTLQPDLESLNVDYVESLIQSKTRIALTSGGNEPVIDSLEGASNSIFASAFIDALELNQFVTTSSDIYKYVSQRVVSTLSPEGISQTPEFAGLLRSGHEGGDFIFRKAPKLNSSNL